MRNILWLGEQAFARALPETGFESVAVLPVTGKEFAWEDVLSRAGFRPDVVVIACGDEPPPVADPLSLPCISVFYSQNNAAWHRLYAQAFDACIVPWAGLENEYGSRMRILWVPAHAENTAPSSGDKIRSCVCDKNCGEDFFSEFARLGIKAAKAENDWAKACEQSEIAVLAGDVSDADLLASMARGVCVVAPRPKHGLEKLFVDGEHFVGYADAGDAAYRVNFLLRDLELTRYIAEMARREVEANHLALHRAQVFTDFLCDFFIGDPEQIIAERRKKAVLIR